MRSKDAGIKQHSNSTYLKISQIEFITEVITSMFYGAIMSHEHGITADVGIPRRGDHLIVHAGGEVAVFIGINCRVLQVPISTDDGGD